jgi:hypothetical protein
MSKGGSSGGVSTATGKIIRSFQQAAPDSGSVPKDVMARAMQGMMATTDVGGFSVKERHIHVLVGGIRYAYISGSSGKEPSRQAIEKILNKRFSISSSKPQGKGAGAPEDYHTVAQINVRHAISDAYAAGQKHEAAATAGPAPALAKKPGGIVGNLAAGPTYNAQGQLVAFTSAGAAPGTAPNKLTVTKDAQGNVTKIETSVHKSPKALAAVKAANAAAAPSFLINQSTATASTPMSKIKQDWQKYSKAGDSNIILRKKGNAIEAVYTTFYASQGPSHQQMFDGIKHVFPNAQLVPGGMGMHEHAFVGSAKAGSKQDTYRYVRFTLPAAAPKATAGKAAKSKKSGEVQGKLPKIGEIRNGKKYTAAGWVPYVPQKP